MVTQGKSSKRKAAILSTLLVQLNKSPELAKIMLLVLVWGHVRSRPGFFTLKERSTQKPSRQDKLLKGKGFSIKRPRERFL